MGNADRPGGDQAATDQATGRRVTVPEAADALGISEDAVRSRIKRGTLETVRTASRVFVVMGAQPTSDRPTDRPTDRPGESNALTSQMQGEIAYLRGQLEAERQAHAEARRIIAGLVERMPPQLEAPSDERGSPETVEAEPEGSEPRSAEGEAEDELDAERVRREMAETTLHEGMAEERRRREEAERERDGLRRELFALRGREEAHEVAEEQQGRGQPQSATGGTPQGARKPLWRRIFGR